MTLTQPAETVPDEAWLRGWLVDEGLRPGATLALDRIGHGYSNLTYALSDGSGRRWVLRRPPPGDLLASAHDVVRVARIMRALGPSDVPVPAVHGIRQDDRDVP